MTIGTENSDVFSRKFFIIQIIVVFLLELMLTSVFWVNKKLNAYDQTQHH